MCVFRMQRMLCRSSQFWARWRLWIIVIIVSQSALVLLFSDIVQRKSSSTNQVLQSSGGTEVGWGLYRNTSTLVEALTDEADLSMNNETLRSDLIGQPLWSGHASNGISQLKFKSRVDKPRLSYSVPAWKLKRIDVARLKQDLDSLSSQVQQSVKQLVQAAANRTNAYKSTRQYAQTANDSRALKDGLAKDNRSPTSKNNNDDSKGTVIGDRYTLTDGWISPGTGGFVNREADGGDSMSSGLLSAHLRRQSSQELQQQKPQEPPSDNNKLGDTAKQLQGKKLRANFVKQSPGQQDDSAHPTGSLARSVRGQVNRDPLGISAVSTVGEADRPGLAKGDYFDGQHQASLKVMVGPKLPGAPSKNSSFASLQHFHSAGIDPLRGKLPVKTKPNPSAGNSAQSELHSKLKFNPRITHLSRSIYTNISKLSLQNNSDGSLPNMTLTESLSFENPPRLSVPNYFHLKEDESTDQHFRVVNGHSCFLKGTDFYLSLSNGTEKKCRCKLGYHGPHCSIPDFVYFSAGSYSKEIVPRNKSRRIINAMTYNMEYELLEARINDLWEVVDVFLILESNFSYHGDPKRLKLWEDMRNGFLSPFHSKILYIFLDHFPEKGREDGWLADRYPRQYIGQFGLRHVLGTRPDDLLIYTDADELPSKEALMFLRLHDGFPEPFGFTLRWSVYGFFWRQFEPTRIWAGCTLAMLRLVFVWDIYGLRSGNYWNTRQNSVATYIRAGGVVSDWHLGGTQGPDGSVRYTGWHCSWCLPPDRIRTKLTSAINADFPRWGDFPEKLDLDYIRGLIKNGVWFDDVTKIGVLVSESDDGSIAPDFILKHQEKFKPLLNLNDALKA